MANVQHKKSPSPPDYAVLLKQSFDWYVEVSKARLTITLTFGLATVTVTGFAVQTKNAKLFFLASLVPLLGLALDLLMKRSYGTVFLYKAAMLEQKLGVPEPIAIGFLDFTRGDDSKFHKILSLKDEKERRRKFRSAYMWNGLGRNLFTYGMFILGEGILGFLSKYIFT